MLFKIEKTNNKLENLIPNPYKDFAEMGKLEKELEELIANNLLDTLFEEATLMPIFQERARQAEADIYALNEFGDLVIFELKRSTAGSDAMLQALRYGQSAGMWTFSILQDKFRTYENNSTLDLRISHKEAFNLDEPLSITDFNKNQKFIIIGSAADDSLINSVDYWKKKGLSVEFIPYRVYEINNEIYFEFFSIPYDRHKNPATKKGVLFDTNKSWNENCVWEMLENNKVSAYGEVKKVINYLNKGDIVFYSHKSYGLIAAAEVIGPIKSNGKDELYREVKFLTSIPSKPNGITKWMAFSQITSILGKNFYWAKTIKVPYLDMTESDKLLKALKLIF
ncbi:MULTISPECIES: PDDEXK family nuclease [Leptospira]|uniref:hypothetical protein n=1 Tax=Leptospira TaxID=171 RepID=UPI001EE82880|nr:MULTISPECIES: hypothetical protein [Leptospira]MCG6146631.1 hypothetical protein [Leptospira bandrabouensis]MCG6162002.1 hypothetical protein [Leptospira bandrabouensis]MCG6166207.1 hypothetical protein [Leptospira bandrabouensis]MCW7471750.1 hypothetical protein [Leptospira kanakyensis]